MLANAYPARDGSAPTIFLAINIQKIKLAKNLVYFGLMGFVGGIALNFSV